MAGLRVFNYNGTEVKTAMVDGVICWVARDVCRVLEIGNTSDALSRLDDDEKGIASIDTLGGKQNVSVINESGLYSLILTSRKPEAKDFKKWIKKEVLPQIRQTGSYSINKEIKKYSAAMIREARLTYGIEYARRMMDENNGQILLPVPEQLPDHIAKQVYAVALAAIKKEQAKSTAEAKTPQLFGGE
jgi:prophage antirepressor-like protein